MEVGKEPGIQEKLKMKQQQIRQSLGTVPVEANLGGDFWQPCGPSVAAMFIMHMHSNPPEAVKNLMDGQTLTMRDVWLRKQKER